MLRMLGLADVLSHIWPATSAPEPPGPSVGADAPEKCEIDDAKAALMSPTIALPDSGEPGRMTDDCDMVALPLEADVPGARDRWLDDLHDRPAAAGGDSDAGGGRIDGDVDDRCVAWTSWSTTGAGRKDVGRVVKRMRMTRVRDCPIDVREVRLE